MIISGLMGNGNWFIVHGSWFIVHSSLVNCLGWLALSPCCFAAYDMQIEMSSVAYWRFMLAYWLTCGYYTKF